MGHESSYGRPPIGGIERLRDARATLDARRGRRRETSARAMASTAVTMPSSALGARGARRERATNDDDARCVFARMHRRARERDDRAAVRAREGDAR